MTLKLASYNIQYGVGKDERFDLKRIVEELGDADIIALQEVEAGNPLRNLVDQPEEFARLLPHEHWVYGPGIDLYLSPSDTGGQSGVRHRFGNMILSRWPLLSVSVHMLPKVALRGTMHLQRTLIEAVIDTPEAPVRVCCTHLEHVSPMTRMPQVETLRDIMLEAPRRGGPWGGVEASKPGFPAPEPAWPREAILLGDMNFAPDSREYTTLIGDHSPLTGQRISRAQGLFDAWLLTGHAETEGRTFIRPGFPELRLDHCFVTPGLADAVKSMWIDEAATGSDHQPIFVTLDHLP